MASAAQHSPWAIVSSKRPCESLTEISDSLSRLCSPMLAARLLTQSIFLQRSDWPWQVQTSTAGVYMLMNDWFVVLQSTATYGKTAGGQHHNVDMLLISCGVPCPAVADEQARCSHGITRALCIVTVIPITAHDGDVTGLVSHHQSGFARLPYKRRIDQKA